MLPIPGTVVNIDAIIELLLFSILVEIICFCIPGVSYSGLSKNIRDQMIFDLYI